jgi:hypothetical protein
MSWVICRNFQSLKPVKQDVSVLPFLEEVGRTCRTVWIFILNVKKMGNEQSEKKTYDDDESSE